MGPFKHTVDDGLDIRKVDLGLIYTSFRFQGFVVRNFERLFALCY